MSSLFLRRAGLVVVGGAAYAGTALLVYNYLTSGQSDQHETQKRLAEQDGFSYIMDPNRVERFQSIADIYDSQIGRDEAFMGINLLRRALLYFHAKGTVLEVGAGTGRNISYYPSTVDRIVLSDSSDQMLLQARQKIQRMSHNDRARFACVEADAAKLNFPDDSFDCVVDTFGLCSFDDPVAVLQEMARVCKPEGKILLLEHGRSKSWQSLSDYLDKNAERHAKNWGCIWNRDLDELLRAAPLNLGRVDTWHFGTTYYVVCRPAEKESPPPQVLATSVGDNNLPHLPDTKIVDGFILLRNGEGIRTLHILGMALNIYTAEFWTTEQLESLDEVMACRTPKQMDFTFSRSVGQSGVTTAWRRQLDASVTYTYDGYEDDRDAFVNMFGPIEKGGTETVIISGDDTHVMDQGVVKGIIRGKDFQKAFFSMWFGEQAVSPDLKTGLLGLERPKVLLEGRTTLASS
jgi:methyltransferase OMS1, mitochondrial